MGLLVWAILQLSGAGWREPPIAAALVVALMLIALFLRRQARLAEPLLPLHLFADPGRAGALAVRALFIGAMVGFFFFSTQLMQTVLHMTPVEAGLGFLPMTVMTFIASLALPRLLTRFGSGPVLAGAFLCAALGLGWLSWAGVGAAYPLAIGLPMMLTGIGNGAALAPLTVAAVRDVAPGDAGAASGLVNAAHQLGGTLGLALLVMLFATEPGDAPAEGAALAHAISFGFRGAALMQLAGLCLTLLPVIPAERRRARAGD